MEKAKHQSGFMPGDSTTNQLLSIYHTITSNLDSRKEVRFIFCDISKAFDRVWHKGLLHKLECYGITGNLLNWFNSYLTNRKQRVITEGHFSSFKNVDAGVPQGSVLGPFLFLLYINDLPDALTNQVKLFADDTSLYAVIDDNQAEIAGTLNTDLENISFWANKWDVKFNPNKTKSVLFSRKKTQIIPQLFFLDTPIDNSHTHKQLGLTFNSDGSWSEHIQNIFEKSYKRLNILKSLKYKLNRETLITMYVAFIRPILEYSSVVWDNCNNTCKQLIESIQLEATRIITGLRKGTPHNILYRELRLETLESRRKKHKLTLMYQILHNNAPQYLIDIVTQYLNDNEDTVHHLRRQRLFNQPLCRSENYYNSFSPTILREFNSIDTKILNSPSLGVFKKLITPVNLDQGLIRTTDILKNKGNRKENIILCQLRNNASNLNFDRFNDHLIDSPLCRCNQGDETSYHYFFECCLYEQQRQELKQNINNQHHLTTIILTHGNYLLSDEININILNAIQKYIKDSKRFA
ncbi:hypothetical protein CI610_03447 [invertebrate metagenome]|uniref:Reverse transcriptase domain-containing protein n=1 Tax=invertebrate metagenome TaxID=1711999 RepID=A0A2H9T361_9ZZZZ